MKQLGAAADGKEWVIRKNGQNIPFVTDGVSSRWCMAVFQEDSAKSDASDALEELPDLQVSSNDIEESTNAKEEPGSLSMVAPLPGVKPAGNLFLY